MAASAPPESTCGAAFALRAQKNGVIDGLAGFFGGDDCADAIGGNTHDDGALALNLAPVGDRERHADHGRITVVAGEAGGADDAIALASMRWKRSLIAAFCGSVTLVRKFFALVTE